jgi:gamma-tubulin complex component 2
MRLNIVISSFCTSLKLSEVI